MRSTRELAERTAFLDRNALPSALPHEIDMFTEFYEQRRKILVARIIDRLKTQEPEPNALHHNVPGGDLDEELAEGDEED